MYVYIQINVCIYTQCMYICICKHTQQTWHADLCAGHDKWVSQHWHYTDQILSTSLACTPRVMTRVLNCWPVPEQSGFARRTFCFASAPEREVMQSLRTRKKQTHEQNGKARLQCVCVCVCVGGPTMYAHPRGHHAGNLKVCHLPIRVWRNWVQQWITFPTWQARVKSYWFAVPENWNQWLYIYIYNYN